MVNLNVSSSTGKAIKGPDIFNAAINNDVAELDRALNEGQRVDSRKKGFITTPLHLACANKSEQFLEVALRQDFNPWLRDQNDRLAIDHAIAVGLKWVASQLHDRMYDERWRVHEVSQIPSHTPEL